MSSPLLLLHSDGFNHQLLLHLPLTQGGTVASGAQFAGIGHRAISMETVPGSDRAATATRAAAEQNGALTELLNHLDKQGVQQITLYTVKLSSPVLVNVSPAEPVRETSWIVDSCQLPPDAP